MRTSIPVGRWIRCTAVATLLTFCPPGPCAVVIISLTSAGSTSLATSSGSAITATVAVLVWIRPCASVAGTRFTWCVPAS